MQIHEITQQQLREGLGNFAKSAGQQLGKAYNAFANTTVGGDIVNAVASPFQKAKAALTTPGGLTSASGYASAMDNYYRGQNATQGPQVSQIVSNRVAQQTQNRAKQLTNQWLQQVKSTVAPTTPSPANTPKAAPGQMPAGVAASKTGKNMQKMFGQPKGGIQDLDSDLEEAVAGPAQQFQQWADSQLATQISGTNKTITMSQVRQDKTAKQKLDATLAAIAKNPSDPTAVETYFMTAMTAMQALSKKMKQSTSFAGSTATGGSISTLISPQSIATIKKMAEDPLTNNEIKKELGLK